ncbi:MAG: Asp-tRNA(Asn)/Glu-tRNA(Gln) amidotransferase subunit GatB [Planctomycetota bacterium]|nr:Asp-tRNA(Asn)/Glu-tRNA(Gln) amidotransferase subunit GatB [Planctomycetota bacterium]
MLTVTDTRLIVGLEIHVELATRSKMFTRAPSPAHPQHYEADPNTLIDPVVLGLPGALPVMNRRAVEMSMLVGLALGCRIAPLTRWDRKSYFYPDLPKNYQLSQYDLPICFDGAADFPVADASGAERTARVAIIRAHLEEDAGKLLHEAPGGARIDFSIADYNRAGTPLLEIVTAPDFTSADQVVAFAQWLRGVCRFLGVTEGVMQRGHMRFEPNINCALTLSDGREITTPIVEVKNLNSFKSLRGAIEYELREQPRRFLEDGRIMGRGAKATRGWDDTTQTTFLQREKEDAHDYRYFPDPDLPTLTIDDSWIARLRDELPELPAARAARYREEFSLGPKEAAALVEERAICTLFEESTDQACRTLGAADPVTRSKAGRLAANLILQSGFKRANERGVLASQLGITPAQLGGIVALRERGEISAAGADELFGELCTSDQAAPDAAARLNLLQVRDQTALVAWCNDAIAAAGKAADDVRAGKLQALGRIIGDVMKRSGGKADAAAVREALLKLLGQS